MASDGPSKPLVPPPPVLGGPSGSTPRSDETKPASTGDGEPTSAKQASALGVSDESWLSLTDDGPQGPETAEDIEDAQTVAADPGATTDQEDTAQAPHGGEPEPEDVEPEEAPAEEPEAAPPPVRRGVLPPPRSEGKRVQPLAATSSRARGPQRPSATGLPAGLRPPGAPEEREHENTDVLIASAVAALTHDADAKDVAEAPDDATAAASRSGAAAAITPTASAQEDEPNRKGLWIGVAALAAAVLLLAVLASGEDDDPDEAQTSSAAAVVSKSDEPAPAEEELPAPEPDEPVADPEDDLVALADTPDLGGALGLEQALDVGSAEAEPEGDTDVGDGETDAGDGETDAAEDADADADATEDAEPSRSSKRRKSRRRRQRDAPSKTKDEPAGGREEEEPDADALLAAAQKALRSGQSRKAYSLASKSRRAKKSTGALVVMARAACRFGGESQAKSAFDKLTIVDRRGIRAECRDHGVRLGL